jgi:diguanylate cyclase (GGDEF)-like protein
MHGLSTKSSFSESIFGILGFSRLKDYKRLSKYLIDIHQASSFEKITNELSGCINDIFSHEFFALAIQTPEKMMVWVEPSVFRETILSVIEKDFSNTEIAEVYSINGTKTGFLKEKKVRDQLYGKEFVGANFQAKLYILPGKKIFSKYHSDLINDIVTGLENAISKHMSFNELKDAASTDPLTLCYNRREFQKNLEQQFSISKRYDKKFSLIMFDIDHFKNINDSFGHQVGDSVLREIADRIRSVTRTEDNFFRYGGEEFVLLLPETDIYDACILAERLRDEIASEPLKSVGSDFYCSASFGVSSFPQETSCSDIVKKADHMLYRAKNSGRNKVMSGIIRLCRNTAEDKN